MDHIPLSMLLHQVRQIGNKKYQNDRWSSVEASGLTSIKNAEKENQMTTRTAEQSQTYVMLCQAVQYKHMKQNI
jgi:hypothetical protein